MSNFLYRTLPPPKYLSMPSFGLDISDRSFKYIAFEDTKDGIRIKKIGKKSIPEKIIESGTIKKHDELISFLKSSAKQIGIKHAVVALPEEKAFLLTLQLPNIDSAEVRGAIEVQIEEHVPLPRAQIVFDYKIAGPSPDKKHIDVVVSAYPKKIAEEYRDVLRAAGIIPLIFEIEAQSITRSVLPKDNLDTVMIIDFGKTRTSFFIVSGQHLRYTSTIDVAGEDIDKAIAKVFGVDMYEAERMKKSRGSILNPEKNDKLYGSILPLISVIKDEADQSFEYWSAHSKHVHTKEGGKISKVILCGGDANLIGFKEYLSFTLKIKVEMANAWVNVASFEDYIPEVEFSASLIYATSIGLGLRAMET